ncbi:MAG: pentapeptide repeat-containing protein [Cyanobacteria bacterium P01_A01_bin.123]
MKAEELLKKYAAGLRDFAGINLNETSLIGATLPEIILRGASLNVANLNSVNFSHSDLAHASLNVSRLSGANLSHANLSQANLNVANLIRAVLISADLSGVSMVRAELLRAELSSTNLSGANLSESDLREVRLRWADLSQANLSRVDLRFSVLTAANLKAATLHAADLSQANLSGANLVEAELRHANLNGANLRGANLRGANLRWADLTGADLREADLSDAKLSGTNLVGANLAGADLVQTSLVHANLLNANLMYTHCSDADWTGATLTGAKLHGAVCTGLITAELNCDWIDMSTTGDRSCIQAFEETTEIEQFFNRAMPVIEIIVDAPLDQSANLALASAYHQLSQVTGVLAAPPNLKRSGRKTILTFSVPPDADLVLTTYLVTLPFKAAATLEPMLKTLLKYLHGSASPNEGEPVIDVYQMLPSSKQALVALQDRHYWNDKFFQSPLQISLTNSHRQTLELYQSQGFGIRGIQPEAMHSQSPLRQPSLSTPDALLAFIQGSNSLGK